MISVSKNNNEQRTFIFHLDYGIDAEKYYYSILLHSHISAYVCTFSMINGDTIFLMFLEHACAVFEIIG